MYYAIGSCNVTEKHPEVMKTVDDYLWLKLCQVREQRDENHSSSVTANADRLTYSLLQSLISEEYGKYFL